MEFVDMLRNSSGAISMCGNEKPIFIPGSLEPIAKRAEMPADETISRRDHRYIASEGTSLK